MRGETVSGEPLSDGGMGAPGAKGVGWAMEGLIMTWSWRQREEGRVCLWNNPLPALLPYAE